MSSHLDALFAHHHAQYRDPRQIVAQWPAAADAVDPGAFACRVTGHWWDILDELAITLVVTREYEHIVQAFTVDGRKKRSTYLPLPHPNGLAVDRETNRLHIASTRNPNVIFDFSPCKGAAPGRGEIRPGTLMPTESRYYPGCLYIHDIARIGKHLYANAVGLNAIVRLDAAGRFEPVWWPKCIDGENGPRFDKNYLQLNSIAAGRTLKDSYFGASLAAPSARRPGHKNFPVDGRGVVFSGRTRDVCGVGLTRPHSARLRDGDVWIDNSGYGQVGRLTDGRFEPFAQLPGWTRGLLFHGAYAFVGSSRVLTKYAHYAPGLVADRCIAGVHVLDLRSGKILGSVTWPTGNQLFAIESLPRSVTPGFPFEVNASASATKRLVHFFGGGVAA